MGLFTGKRRKFQLSAIELPQDDEVEVHGESHYQPALQRTAKLAMNRDGERVFQAILVAEPDNPYDRNAVAVYSRAGLLGYLPRETAPSYRTVFAEIHRQGCKAGACEGLLIGGKPDKPFYGVILRLSSPTDCLRDLKSA